MVEAFQNAAVLIYIFPVFEIPKQILQLLKFITLHTSAPKPLYDPNYMSDFGFLYAAQYLLHHRNINVQICRMKVCERRRTELYAKQGRKNQFTTAEARDRWITEVN